MLLRAQRAGMAVHVPLDIGNGRGIEDPADTFDDIVPHLRLREIEQQLVPAQKISAAKTVMQRPVRVRAVKLRIRADGFRLEPESKLQSHRIQLLTEALQAARKLFRVYGIIAETAGVAVALSEPAVVEHEQLAAQLLCKLSEPQELRLREVEHAALPAVVDDGPRPVSPIRRNERFINITSKALRHAAEACVGPRHNSLRRLKPLPGRKLPAEIRGRNALHHARETLQAPLRAQIMTAGIEQIEAADRAGCLCRVRRGKQKAGIRAAGRRAGRALQTGPRHGDRRFGMLHLRDPAAGKGMQRPVARKIRAAAHELPDGNRRVAAVFQDRPARKDRRQNAVQKRQPELCHAILQIDGKNRLPARDRQRGGQGSLQRLAAGISELCGDRQAVLHQLCRTFAVIAAPAAAPFERENIQTVGVGALLVERAVAPAAAGPDGERVGIGCADACTEVQMLQKSVFDTEQIGAFFVLQMKYTVSDCDHSIR